MSCLCPRDGLERACWEDFPEWLLLDRGIVRWTDCRHGKPLAKRQTLKFPLCVQEFEFLTCILYGKGLHRKIQVSMNGLFNALKLPRCVQSTFLIKRKENWCLNSYHSKQKHFFLNVNFFRFY